MTSQRLSYRVKTWVSGDHYRQAGYANSWDQRRWYAAITFDQPISEELFEELKKCRPQHYYTYRGEPTGKRLGFTTYERLPGSEPIGQCRLDSQCSFVAVFDTPWRGQQQREDFLSNAAELLVRLHHCESCGASTTA